MMAYFLRPEDDPVREVPNQLDLDSNARQSIERLNSEIAAGMVALMITDAEGPRLPELMKNAAGESASEGNCLGWEISIDAVWYMTRARLCSMSVMLQNAALTVSQPADIGRKLVSLAPYCPGCLGTGTAQRLGFAMISSLFSGRGSNEDQTKRLPAPIVSACTAAAEQIDEMRGRGAFDPLLRRAVDVLVGVKKSIFHYQIEVLARVAFKNKEIVSSSLGSIVLAPRRITMGDKTYELTSSWEMRKEASIIETIQPKFVTACSTCRGLRFNPSEKIHDPFES